MKKANTDLTFLAAANKIIGFLFAVLFVMTSCGGTQPEQSAEESYPTKITAPQAQPESYIEDSIDPTELYIASKIAAMSIEEKVGQLFLVRAPLTEIPETAVKYKLGGYVYFADNFRSKTRDEISDEIGRCQSLSDIPMLFAVDEEGGTVNRISRFAEFRHEPFLSPRDLFANGGFDRIKKDTAEKCELLLSLGVNLNLAPVCDISDDVNDFIYFRSIGLDAQGTSDYVRTVVNTMNEYNVGSALKHFPGYGNNEDTHMDVVYDNRAYEIFETGEFLPFIAGIESGAGSIMVSHNIMTGVDGNYPASLSVEVHQILRNELKFDGVIMTDDLAMEGIRKYTDGNEAAVRAMEAGNDMLCCSDYESQLPAVIMAVRDGRLTETRIDESVARILKWKMDLKLIDIYE
jgi:beta-N-acetylhexosaminidase